MAAYFQPFAEILVVAAVVALCGWIEYRTDKKKRERK